MQAITQNPAFAGSAISARIRCTQQVLRFTFGLVPIVAGLDKFANLLAHWSDYLSPLIDRLIPLSAEHFMRVVGVIEIVAGVIVLARPRVGAWIVTAWLVAIALELISSGHYLDIAVRDLVMAVGAFTLARLSAMAEGHRTVSL